MITTPYYRTIPEIHGVGCSEPTKNMYRPYDIFLLETRLNPIVYDLFERDVNILFKSEKDVNNTKSKNILSLNITLIRYKKINKLKNINKQHVVKLSSDQKKILNDAVNDILSTNVGYCLIDKNELYIAGNKKYTKSWFNTMLGYVDLPTDFNPFLSENGIYLAFNPESDYIKAYNDVVGIILNTLDDFYEKGVVYGAKHIAESWNLAPLDIDEIKPKLFQPMWKDTRFAPNLVDFLLEKIRNNPHIYVDVSDNLVSRHNIAKELNKKGIDSMFENNYVKMIAKDLDEAQRLTSLVKSVPETEGKVVTLMSNQSLVVLDLINQVKNLNKDENTNCTGYQVSDIKNPYVFSCLIDINDSEESFLERLRM